MENSEKFISAINSNIFFREFTFSKNQFMVDHGKEQLELADNFIWLDDILFIIQIKERNKKGKSSEIKWFENKVLKKAVHQIKNSIKYLYKFKNIIIVNEKGHEFNVAEAKNITPQKLIIYTPGNNFPQEKRFQKFYISKEVGYIHLFHSEDYLWICNYLITPFEINEYLSFRKQLYCKHQTILDAFPEQYVLGHYIETINIDHINPKYVENIKNMKNDIEEFDISNIISNFQSKIYHKHNNRDYYQIIKELAKLHRAELREFKKRYLKAIEKSEDLEFTMPYRMTSLNSNCGFVFIPLHVKYLKNWKNAIMNLTKAHKYDQQLDKCIGIILCHNVKEKHYEINWLYLENPWVFNPEVEQILKENFPFRGVKRKILYRYFLKE